MNRQAWRRFLVSGLLLITLWGGACAGKRDTPGAETAPPPPTQQEMEHFSAYRNRLPAGTTHYFDRTEVDIEHGHSVPASRYNQPRWTRPYRHDRTEVDLAGSKVAEPAEREPPASASDLPSGQEPQSTRPDPDR